MIKLLALLLISWTNAMIIDDMHCQLPTCRDFYQGLRDYPRYDDYYKVCYDTVLSLQAIPREHGPCINSKTRKIHEPCFYALAETIKTCIQQLYDIPEKDARFYCGYTLMYYCSGNLGLAGYPLNFKV